MVCLCLQPAGASARVVNKLPSPYISSAPVSAVAHSGVRWRGSIIWSCIGSVHGSACLCATLAWAPTRAHYRSFSRSRAVPIGYPLQPECPCGPAQAR
eukprot:scaffold135825_cov157-Phaeocystis_antarctica.AAC.2